jgi:hypothetical protein
MTAVICPICNSPPPACSIRCLAHLLTGAGAWLAMKLKASCRLLVAACAMCFGSPLESMLSISTVAVGAVVIAVSSFLLSGWSVFDWWAGVGGTLGRGVVWAAAPEVDLAVWAD